ncbi:ferritin-like domain-containing protein [Kitasatospora sp. DSM 101779]|uniref:ferritin-like domain-containing protein n=1 Tax=Kitasatospora sp. DSM 101779 TaxID=2853165 RepID=UPI0021DA3398|nr:ferritin-like domain-containing protein [Kitasatospora sp. DSM 101779]MCU7825857.1 bacterioferritin [Kitasatospora sp. DSM 101779]
MADSFAVDVTRISREALRTMAAEPDTAPHLDEERAISVLNDVIATEVVGWLRYTRDALAAAGGDPEAARAAALLTAQADQGMRHAVAVAERITVLGGRPNFDPDTLAQRAHTDYSVPADAALTATLDRNLRAERIVLATYREIADWFGDRDPDSRDLLHALAADVRRNAEALEDLLRTRAS